MMLALWSPMAGAICLEIIEQIVKPLFKGQLLHIANSGGAREYVDVF